MKRGCVKYHEVVEALRNEILSGKYVAHKPFPSQTKLIARFGISKLTVVKVLDRLKDLGLVCSRQGRGTFVTRTAGQRKIGLIIPGVGYSEFFPPIAAEIARLAEKGGYELQLGEVTAKKTEERIRQVRELAEEMIAAGVAGVIYHPLEFAGDSSVNAEVVDAFDRANVQVVFLDRKVRSLPGGKDHDVVGIDNFQAGRDLARHLLAVGAKRIGYLARKGLAPLGNRYEGLRSEVSRAANRYVEALLPDTDSPRKLAAELKRLKLDAVVCANDAIAEKFQQALGKLHLRVPEDMLLAGFDDVRIAALMTPPLTSVRQPCAEIAGVAFRRLVERIAEPSLPAVRFCLSAPVVVRGSTARQEFKRKITTKTIRRK